MMPIPSVEAALSCSPSDTKTRSQNVVNAFDAYTKDDDLPKYTLSVLSNREFEACKAVPHIEQSVCKVSDLMMNITMDDYVIVY